MHACFSVFLSLLEDLFPLHRKSLNSIIRLWIRVTKQNEDKSNDQLITIINNNQQQVMNRSKTPKYPRRTTHLFQNRSNYGTSIKSCSNFIHSSSISAFHFLSFAALIVSFLPPSSRLFCVHSFEPREKMRLWEHKQKKKKKHLRS